jgi:polysaccharide export outer membrane protein
MSEHEFEAYLALLGGMLGLSDEQREAISGELRDHMLERMHEQMAAGVPRNEAIQQALAEFGDASRLAAGLAAAATLHRRRLIMRWTFGTVVTFGLLLFVALAYWPAGENGPGPQMSVGQQQNELSDEAAVPDSIQVVSQDMVLDGAPNERAFAALQQRVDVDTVQSPVRLEQFFRDLARKIDLEADVELPDEQLEQLLTEVSLLLEDAPVSTILNLLTSRIPGVSFTIRDGALVLISADRMHGFVRLYPVGDLVAVEEVAANELVIPGFELPRLVKERQQLLLQGKAEDAERYDKAIVLAAEMLVRDTQFPRAPKSRLAGLLQTVIDPAEWEINGGPYSIQTYGDVLVVFASLPLHWEITQTLTGLRKYAVADAAPGHRERPLEDQLRPSAAEARPAFGAASEETASGSDATIPPYIIEPPDILLISALKTVPKSPYKLRPFDVIIIRTIGVFEELGQPIVEAYSIQPDGAINLGPTYGKVEVVDQTVDEAADFIEKHLKQFVKSPKVAVSLAAASEMEKVQGQHLVGPDGRVNLGSYGQVYVAGKTIVEAKAAVEEKLAEKLQDPKVIVDVVAYNSKVYYVITQGDGRGDNVVRVPITGNETVLDALSNKVAARPGLSSKRIWIVRPAPNGVGLKQELPVDWNAITHEGVTTTNYQILPGDRIFIASNDADVQEERLLPRDLPATVR